MSTLFKDIYSNKFYDQLSNTLTKSLTGFNKKKFMRLIYNDQFENYELKERMLHTAIVLHEFMPEIFCDAVPKLKMIINKLRDENIEEDSIEFMFFPEYIAHYGINDFDSSIQALEFITQFTSCEFAVRPLIIKHEKAMMQQMLKWCEHESFWVRRLATEGSRPRLPWAMALPAFKKDPSLVLPILKKLKNDKVETVRRSVANNLNDIAKDNVDVVVKIATEWKGKNKQTDALIKHACRTLLKQAQPEIMALFGFDSQNFQLTEFIVINKTVVIGESVEFSFKITNHDKKERLLRLEYGLYYQKKNGALTRKVFKISERKISAGSSLSIVRKQSFKIITTRIFHIGEHQISIIVNGKESNKLSFELT